MKKKAIQKKGVNNMKKSASSLGDLVASEMNNIVNSEEHIDMFTKVAKKKEKEEDKKSKKDKPGKFELFKKKDKKDDKAADGKGSKKKDKKSKKEMTSESMLEFVNLLTEASNTLDECGFVKSSALTLQALDTLISEAALDIFAGEEDEDIEDLLSDPELAKVLDMSKHKEHTPDYTEDPALELELAGIGDDVEPTHVFDDIDEVDDNEELLKDLGLGKKDQEDSYVDEDVSKVLAKLDAFIAKNAGDLDDPELTDEGFDYSSDLGDKELIRMPKEHKHDPDWKKYKDLTPSERLEHEMGAGLHERLPMDPDELSDEEVYPDVFEDMPRDEDAEFANRNKWDYDNADDDDEESERELLRRILSEDPDAIEDEDDEFEPFGSLTKALREDEHSADDDEDFEDEE
jgi:hypothetical protein